MHVFIKTLANLIQHYVKRKIMNKFIFVWHVGLIFKNQTNECMLPYCQYIEKIILFHKIQNSNFTNSIFMHDKTSQHIENKKEFLDYW